MHRAKLMKALTLVAASTAAYLVVKHVTRDGKSSGAHVAGWHGGHWGWGGHHGWSHGGGWGQQGYEDMQPQQTWLYGGGTTNPYNPYMQQPYGAPQYQQQYGVQQQPTYPVREIVHDGGQVTYT